MGSMHKNECTHTDELIEYEQPFNQSIEGYFTRDWVLDYHYGGAPVEHISYPKTYIKNTYINEHYTDPMDGYDYESDYDQQGPHWNW